MFLHRLQQRGLRFRRGAVDFVRQDDVGKKRPFDEYESAAARLIGFLQNIGAGDVRRHQVRRELDAVELQRHRLGQRVDDGRFGQSRHPHQQPVPARQNADQQLLDDDVLPDDDPGQFGAKLLVNGSQFVNCADVVPGKRCRYGCGRMELAGAVCQSLFSHN